MDPDVHTSSARRASVRFNKTWRAAVAAPRPRGGPMLTIADGATPEIAADPGVL